MITEQGSNGDDTQLMEEETGEGTSNKKNELPDEGLKLAISDSLLTYTKLMLAWNESVVTHTTYNSRSKFEEIKTAQHQLINANESKNTPAVMPVLGLTIASKKKVVCQITLNKVVCQKSDEKLLWKMEIPFSHITSLLVCFDYEGFDTLEIEARSSFKCFSADKTRLREFTSWEVDDSIDGDSFPRSKVVFLEIEKGKLEKSIAKLLYTDPRLTSVLHYAKATSHDQHMYHGGAHAYIQQQQINTLGLHTMPADNVFPTTSWCQTQD
ncbi:hypothetical protein ACP4OV_001474 [Aristida adscensionis]